MSKNLSEDYEILDSIRKKVDDEGDNHILTNLETPILEDAFDLSDEEKIERVMSAPFVVK